MSKRVVAGRREGFFTSLVEGDVLAVDDGVLLEVKEELVEGVYRVERVVVERWKRKVSCSFTANFVQCTSTISGEN